MITINSIIRISSIESTDINNMLTALDGITCAGKSITENSTDVAHYFYVDFNIDTESLVEAYGLVYDQLNDLKDSLSFDILRLSAV